LSSAQRSPETTDRRRFRRCDCYDPMIAREAFLRSKSSRIIQDYWGESCRRALRQKPAVDVYSCDTGSRTASYGASFSLPEIFSSVMTESLDQEPTNRMGRSRCRTPGVTKANPTITVCNALLIYACRVADSKSRARKHQGRRRRRNRLGRHGLRRCAPCALQPITQ